MAEVEGPERGRPEGEPQPGGGESRRWWDAIEWKAWRKTQNPAHRRPGGVEAVRILDPVKSALVSGVSRRSRREPRDVELRGVA